MCDVPSIAGFCSESTECFPGTASKFFLNLLVTIPVAPIITDTIVHFRFHIRCISIHKLLYFNFFSYTFSTTFLSAGIATSIIVHVFSFLFLIIILLLLLSSSLLNKPLYVITHWYPTLFFSKHTAKNSMATLNSPHSSKTSLSFKRKFVICS